MYPCTILYGIGYWMTMWLLCVDIEWILCDLLSCMDILCGFSVWILDVAMMQCVPAMLVWIKNSYHDYYNWIMGLHEMMHYYSVLCTNLIVFWCIYALFCMSSDIGWSSSPYVDIQFWEDFFVWILDENAAAQYIGLFCHMALLCSAWKLYGYIWVLWVDSGWWCGCSLCGQWTVKRMFWVCILDCYVHDLCDLLSGFINVLCVDIERLNMFDHSVWISDSYVYVLCVDAGLLCGFSVCG